MQNAIVVYPCVGNWANVIYEFYSMEETKDLNLNSVMNNYFLRGANGFGHINF